MPGVAETLAGLVAQLPSLAAFVMAGGVSLAVVAGVLFRLRRSGPVSALCRQVDTLLSALLAVSLLAMVFLSGLQILLRNFFDSGLLWIDPLLRHLVLVVALIGAIVATGGKRHVQINVLGRLLRGPVQHAAGAAVAVLALGVCLALAHASLLLLRDELAFPEVEFLSVPSWAIVALFPAAFLVLAYRFAWLVFSELAGEAPRAPEVEAELATREGSGS